MKLLIQYTDEVCEWVGYVFLQFTGHVNTYPCLSILALKLIHVRKMGPRCQSISEEQQL